MKSRFNISESEDKILRVTMSTLIINVDSILSKCESVELFGLLHDLWGHSNGELYVLTEKQDPPWGLHEKVEKVLNPLGFEEYDDYVFVFERNMTIFRGVVPDGLNDPIPSCKKTNWITSIMASSGHYVCHKKSEDAFLKHDDVEVLYTFCFRKYSDEGVVQAINNNVGNPGMVPARMAQIFVIRQELNRRQIDYSCLQSESRSFSTNISVILQNKKLYPL